MRILVLLCLVCISGCGLSYGQRTGDGKHALCVIKVEGLKNEVPLVLPNDADENPLKNAESDVLYVQVIKNNKELKPFIEKYGDQAKAGIMIITLKSLDHVSDSIKEKFAGG